jgi:hypothetical protein
MRRRLLEGVETQCSRRGLGMVPRRRRRERRRCPGVRILMQSMGSRSAQARQDVQEGGAEALLHLHP